LRKFNLLKSWNILKNNHFQLIKFVIDEIFLFIRSFCILRHCFPCWITFVFIYHENRFCLHYLSIFICSFSVLLAQFWPHLKLFDFLSNRSEIGGEIDKIQFSLENSETFVTDWFNLSMKNNRWKRWTSVEAYERKNFNRLMGLNWLKFWTSCKTKLIS
jgi:hypothetical protein